MNKYMQSDGTFKLILAVGLIHDSQIVTKPTGSREFTVKRKMPVHFEKGLSSNIKMPDNVIYLCNDDGVTVVYECKPMAVHFDDLEELIDFLEQVREKIK